MECARVFAHASAMRSWAIGVGSWIVVVACALGCGDKGSAERREAATKIPDQDTTNSKPPLDTPFVCPEDVVEFCGQRFPRDDTGPSSPGSPDEPDSTRVRTSSMVKCTDRSVTDLRPISCLSDVRIVFLLNVQATDLTPLATNHDLRRIELYSMPVTDLTPLAGLSKLEHLYLSNLPVTDISVVAGFRKLEDIKLERLRVADLSPLARLELPTHISLEDLPARDLAPLAGHSKLIGLALIHMNLPDLSPLAGLPLEFLNLSTSTISDLGPLGAIGSLKDLSVGAITAPAGQLEALKARRPNLVVEGKPGYDESVDLLYPKRD
jgi:hypothetical protein